MDKNNLQVDGFDLMTADEAFASSPELKRTLEEGAKVLDNFRPLAEDLFSAYYKMAPELTEQCPPGTELNRTQLEKCMEAAQFEELRQHTILDDFGSTVALKTTLDEVVKRLQNDKELQEARNKQNEINKDQEQGNEPTPEQLAELQRAIDQSQGAIRRAVTAGLKQATQQAEENSQLVEGFGWGSEDGEFKRLPFEAKKELLEKARALKSKAELIGRYRNIARSTRKSKLDYQRVELHGVTLGNDLQRLMPQELVGLGHPVLKRDLLRRVIEGQAMQYHLEHKDNVGRGPILIAQDDSGSMSSHFEGYARSDHARAATFGLLEIAKHEKRHFGWCVFSSGPRGMVTGEILDGKVTPEETLNILSTHLGGGTDFVPPLTWAMEKINDSKFDKADLVLITDGECDISPEFAKKLTDFKQLRGLRVWVVSLGYRAHFPWADGVWSDMSSESIQQLFQGV